LKFIWNVARPSCVYVFDPVIEAFGAAFGEYEFDKRGVE